MYGGPSSGGDSSPLTRFYRCVGAVGGFKECFFDLTGDADAAAAPPPPPLLRAPPPQPLLRAPPPGEDDVDIEVTAEKALDDVLKDRADAAKRNGDFFDLSTDDGADDAGADSRRRRRRRRRNVDDKGQPVKLEL